MARRNWTSLIQLSAQRYGVDPRAALAVASMEGLSGRVGDRGTSFGPFQLHVGGALPAGRGRAWAESKAGIDYAIRTMAQSAHGLTGKAAVNAIVRNFERPADPNSEVAGALSHYGGSFSNPLGGSQSASPAMNPLGGGNSSDFRMQLAQKLLDASSNGGQMDAGSLLGMALARSAQSATTTEPPPSVGDKSVTGGRVALEGNSSNLNSGFVSKLQEAVSSIGGTQVRITSGYRSPGHNRAVGGAPNSNHVYGHAIDGDVFIPGKGWQPLGEALRGVAPKFGLRSGASFNWGGKPDIVHVDDGYNQR